MVNTDRDSLIKPEKNKLSEAKKDIAKGLVFSIQSYSVHDGPGMRTTVFLNGCPLKCGWCCNPEGLHPKQIMLYSSVKCKTCGACIEACPNDAVKLIDGKLQFDRSKCDQCSTMECTKVCLNEGISIAGIEYTVDELMSRFQRERHFWGAKGGVTFSGGEPLMQKEFILPLLKECKDAYINTCIETTGCVDSAYFLEALSYIDWVFMDLKHLDPKKHKELTGVDNQLILKNIKLLAQAPWWNGFIVPRIPIIPGCNDDADNIRATAKFVKEIGLEVINILPFHRLGESKYRQLGRAYSFVDQTSPSAEHMNNLKEIIESEGIICFVGHDTPF